MGQSYRIRTELGISKTINIQLDQEFEFLEILSLKLQQEDVYTKSCAEYGVVVGRVTANNGFGLPNARVSIFIPIESVDESNPLISSIYPYKSPNDRNEDGYRYNLLPYEQSYSTHAATGTLPTRLDALTGSTAIEIYDKYYKLTVKTNDSGDYMIMGVPQGQHTLVMDVDLSDIGEFSLTPQDLIRMGLASEAQVAGNRFRTSNDLNSLPQIINLVKQLEVSPLWGDPELCDIAINRVDFDLRDEANIDIQPTSTFMGSIFSTSDAFRIRKNCKPRDNMGNLCSLSTGPGQILSIRQTIAQDEDGNPVLEQFQLEQAGNIIDGDGTWLTELPMNLDYYITNEFGEKVLSNDPTVGIPTKGKYRFKVKWQQPQTLSEQTRRPYYLLPNVKEYGWNVNNSNDPINYVSTSNEYKQAHSSYYFGLAWSGYTDGFTNPTQKTKRLNEVINCEDTFYQFDFNRVYTPSMLMTEFKKGARGRFIGIKEIDSQECESSVNKFPANDGFRNFDLLFFVFSILFTVIQVITLPIITLAHILIFLYNLVFRFICAICQAEIRIFKWSVRPFGWICRALKINCDKKDYTIRLPMITYPECQSCDCKSDLETTRENTLQNQAPNSTGNGFLTYFSAPQYYNTAWEQWYNNNGNAQEDIQNLSIMSSEALGGLASTAAINTSWYKLPISSIYNLPSIPQSAAYVSKSLPLGERINLFNQRSNFFVGLNRIRVTFAKSSNIGKFHYDNTITVISTTQYNSGDLLTFINPSSSKDVNYLYSATTITGTTQGISGESYNSTASTMVNVTYATAQYLDNTVSYSLPYGSDNIKYQFPSDIEYYQVVTAITLSQAALIWNTGTTEQFPNLINTPSVIDELYDDGVAMYTTPNSRTVNPLQFYQDYDSQYILILQRGVDPYSPKYVNEYDVSILFGKPLGSPGFTVTATTRLNIPIQKLSGGYSTSVQSHANQTFITYQSYFFKPGIPGSTIVGQQYTGFTTNNIAYYGALDSTKLPSTAIPPIYIGAPPNKVISVNTNGIWNSSPNSAKYDNSEDVSGLSIMYMGDYKPPGAIVPSGVALSASWPSNLIKNYYTQVLWVTIPTSPFQALLSINFSSSNLNVMRTDRLPSSDILDGGSWILNPSLLQQNLNFGIYQISDNGETLSGPNSNTGASQVTPDIEGLPNSTSVLESFNCETMVGLDCYEGFGSSFQINPSCPGEDAVDKGCYMFMRRPILDLIKDYKTFAEWGFRFRFFYGLCRGVLSQSFVNNWINGSLYMFPIQVDTFYDTDNKPKLPVFCKTLVYFDFDTNNFYYRSSPYDAFSNKFRGRDANEDGAVNDRNLMFPTTIMNLGFKDIIYSELSFDPSTRAYVIPDINSTSYSDPSDLVNLFVISRITDEGFLASIISAGDNSIDQLFSRPQGSGTLSLFSPKKRVDGDFAQLLSINSEIGNISFSPEYYEIQTGTTNNPTQILGTASNPTIAVWFSSTTDNLQTKDYLTPGRIDFRSDNNSVYYPYNYGIKSQVVPFYQWKLSNTSTIFGSQYNTWATTKDDIVQGKAYQSLDRTNITTPSYFMSNNLSSNPTIDDLGKRGYIFSTTFCYEGVTAGGPYSYVDCSGNIQTGSVAGVTVKYQSINFGVITPTTTPPTLLYSTQSPRSSKFIVGAPFQFYFGTVKGASALDKFKTKYSVVE
jgi:hypothetical protein